MKRWLYINPMTIAVTALAMSCAGSPAINDRQPDWIASAVADSQTDYVLRGTGVADNLPLAKEEALNELVAHALEKMNLAEPSNWKMGGRIAVEAFKDELESALRRPEYYIIKGLEIINREAWKDDAGINFAMDISWNKQEYIDRTKEITMLTGVSAQTEFGLMERAREAEYDKNAYEAALIWGVIAGDAERKSSTAEFSHALSEVSRLLDGIDYEVVSASEEVIAGVPPTEPFVFRATYDGQPVNSAEYVISYPINLPDGTLSRSSNRVLSDEDGRIEFFPSIITTEGLQRIMIAPSAAPFLAFLTDTDTRDVVNFSNALEIARVGVEYESLARFRDIATGIIIIETDLAGNPLNSIAAAGGVFDDLLADGFAVTMMKIEQQKLLTRTRESLLRDLKADSQYSNEFSRVIHGIVALESFEQEGDAYTVRVGGTLILSDIQREVIIHQSKITKTSRAGNGQQAMNAAFRQLGRSFAAELITRAR